MHRLSIVTASIALRLIACLALFGCNDAGYSINPAAGTPGAAGIVDVVPQIDGEWLAAATVTSNSCGPLLGVPPDEMVLSITQADTAVELALITPCEGNTGTATGTLTADNVLTAIATRTTTASLKCTLETNTSLTAVADQAGSHLDGSVVVAVTPVVTPSTDCGSGFPCSYELMLAADRCPASGCLPGACPAPAAP
jgi:hypothetical protein